MLFDFFHVVTFGYPDATEIGWPLLFSDKFQAFGLIFIRLAKCYEEIREFHLKMPLQMLLHCINFTVATIKREGILLLLFDTLNAPFCEEAGTWEEGNYYLLTEQQIMGRKRHSKVSVICDLPLSSPWRCQCSRSRMIHWQLLLGSPASPLLTAHRRKTVTHSQ